MARITFSLPDELAKAAERRATEDRRSLSSHIAVLVERDARAAGLLPDGEVKAAILAASEELGLTEALAALQREARKKKRAA